jgi:hypothetical protein
MYEGRGAIEGCKDKLPLGGNQLGSKLGFDGLEITRKCL